MRQRVSVAAGLALALCSCATPLEKGVSAYNAGEYDIAAAKWRAGALAGESNAQYNMGLLWSQGLGSTPKNPEEAAAWFLKAARQGHAPAMVALAKYQLDVDQPDAALSWLNIAARWNDPTAISMLHSFGAPVPAADLYQSAQQAVALQQQKAAANQAQLGFALGCLIAGGCPQQGAQPRTSQQQKGAPPRATPVYASTEQPLVSQTSDSNWNYTCRYADGTEISSGKIPCPPKIAGRY